MSWQIGTVTLPFAPNRVSDSHPVETDIFLMPGELPVIIAVSLQARSLSVAGEVYGGGSTTANLESNFIIPLRNYKGTTCTITFPDSRYNGTWMCINFESEEVAEGGMAKLKYSMQFSYGKSYVIL